MNFQQFLNSKPIGELLSRKFDDNKLCHQVTLKFAIVKCFMNEWIDKHLENYIKELNYYDRLYKSSRARKSD